MFAEIRLPIRAASIAASFAILCLLLPGLVRAATGDTLLVQTFTFDDIAVRRGVFEFPAEQPWEKILMRYTLKCDERTPGDPHPCGEWDVTTHTTLRRPGSGLDSVRHEHPRLIVDGEAPERFVYSREPRWRIRESWAFDSADGAILPGRYLRFDGTDCLQLPAGIFATIDSAFTLALWVRGDAVQPRGDQLFEASERGARVINLHLPWASGALRFEAGGKAEGNNNRIEKPAAPGLWKGRWNHWAFVKDAREATMRIYLNGELWHEAGNMGRTMEGIDAACLGANASGRGGWYAGAVDEVQLWDAALDGATLAAWRHRRPEASHPYWPHLRASYSFEEGLHRGLVFDASPHGHHAATFGQPESRDYGFEGGQDHLPGPRARLAADSSLAALKTVTLHEDTLDVRRPSGRLDLYPAMDFVYDGSGVLLERRPAPPEVSDTLEQRTMVSWGEPFEIVESIELARYITPYGLGLDLGEDGFRWWVEVSDYAPWLQGRVDIEAHNGFELIDLAFLFIEGRPARTVHSIEPLWPLTQARYGDHASGEVFEPRILSLRPETQQAWLLSRISGHGHAGAAHCCEWAPKEHLLRIAGLERHRWTVWTNCGLNPVHPQGGTWQFDRAGWCPGSFVDTHRLPLMPWLRPGEDGLLELAVEPPDPGSGEGDGVYIIASQLLQTSAPTFARDAELLAVLAPSAADEQRRLNPLSTSVWLEIRNRGALPLEQLRIDYGLEGGPLRQERWTGRLEFLEVDTLRLPPLDGPWPAGSRLHAEIRLLQGRDEYPSNNRLSRPLPEPLRLPQQFVVAVQSPGFGRAAENRWRIEDADGAVHAMRSEFQDDSLHLDELSLEPGAYRFVFEDAAQDGLIRHWWLRGSAPERMGDNGRVQLRTPEGAVLLDLGFDFAEGVAAGFFVVPQSD
jgi:hypothetical protein